jgi:hypothetical protein
MAEGRTCICNPHHHQHHLAFHQVSVAASSPMSPEEKLQVLLEGLEEIRQKLDDTISQIDDLAVEVDDRG